MVRGENLIWSVRGQEEAGDINLVVEGTSSTSPKSCSLERVKDRVLGSVATVASKLGNGRVERGLEPGMSLALYIGQWIRHRSLAWTKHRRFLS